MAVDILIFSASYGAGHHSVSAAIEAAIRKKRPDLSVTVRDYFDFVSPGINALTRFAYVSSVRHAPVLWGAFYNATGNVKPDSAVQRTLNRLGRKELLDFLGENDPRIIVCTYPTPAGVLSTLREEGKDTPPCITVITDYAVHTQWVHSNVDKYLVPSEHMIADLAERGVPSNRVVVTGMPIKPRFGNISDRAGLFKKYGLDSTRPVILVMAGAFAMLGGVDKIVEACLNMRSAPQLLVVCGYSKKLKTDLQEKYGNSASLHLFGFVDFADELMEVSNLLITKAGGITISEALVKKLPMIIFKPIPGQEEFNTRFLVDNGAACVAEDADDLIAHLRELLRSMPTGDSTGKGKIEMMAEAAGKLGRPDAADDAASEIISMCESVSRDYTAIG